MPSTAAINYAEQYSRELANAFPNVLRFGDLYQTTNNQTYKVIDARSIKIPTTRTSGRIDGDRDSIGQKKRNYANAWEVKTLTNHRTWGTLIHPKDIDQTNYVASIVNITKTFNETQKFIEMDRYCISKIFSDWVALGNTAITTALTVANILSTFDKMMEDMDEANVPDVGRILYVTPAVKTLLKNAESITRTINLKDSGTQLVREVSRIDEVIIRKIPSSIMKTKFDFTEGSKPDASSKDINMAIIHPNAVFTPVQYEFASLEAPGAMSDGKYVYYEESFEDAFILNEKATAINFVISA